MQHKLAKLVLVGAWLALIAGCASIGKKGPEFTGDIYRGRIEHSGSTNVLRVTGVRETPDGIVLLYGEKVYRRYDNPQSYVAYDPATGLILAACDTLSGSGFSHFSAGVVVDDEIDSFIKGVARGDYSKATYAESVLVLMSPVTPMSNNPDKELALHAAAALLAAADSIGFDTHNPKAKTSIINLSRVNGGEVAGQRLIRQLSQCPSPRVSAGGTPVVYGFEEGRFGDLKDLIELLQYVRKEAQ